MFFYKFVAFIIYLKTYKHYTTNKIWQKIFQHEKKTTHNGITIW